MTQELGSVPPLPRISAADRADGSVEVLVQGESVVFAPLPGQGTDDARLRALRHLQGVAVASGRPVRVTTWTLDRSRASLVVAASGECYDEARPHSSFVIPTGRATSSGASPAADIPAATRPWGLALPPAPPIRTRRAPSGGSHRTRVVVAVALALLLLWSGVVAVLLTTGHNDSAAAGEERGATTVTTVTTDLPTPATTRPAPASVIVRPPVPPEAPPAPQPVVRVEPAGPGRLRITVAVATATRAHPARVRLRIDPATGAVVRRVLTMRSARRGIVVRGLSAGRATWFLLVSDTELVRGFTRVVAARPPPVAALPTAVVPDPAATPTPEPSADDGGRSPGHHGQSHHQTHHHHGDGHVSTEPHGGGQQDGPPPPHPIDPTNP